jgi:hypothetical protein
VISGTSTKKGVEEYLTLLSVAQTCEYQGLDFLAFLRPGERDVAAFARQEQKSHRHRREGQIVREREKALRR